MLHAVTPTNAAEGQRASAPPPLLYTLQSAAVVVDLSTATLRRHEKAGRLRFVRIGGRTMVDAASLHAFARGEAA